jgi:hypothetical protein
MQERKTAARVIDWSAVDIAKLRRWYADVSKKPEDFLAEFGISYAKICAKRRRLNLPPRPRIWRNFVDDPTPEEIAERAAACRRRHFEQVRRYGQPEPQPSKMMCQAETPDLTPRIFCGGML